MSRRSGLTLVEVLVAIFVMGIGMIALLTLFPIGVLQMAQAIRQDRCLRAAHAADTVSTLPLGLDATGAPTSIRYDAVMMNNAALVGAAAPLYGMDASFFSSYRIKAPVGGPLVMPEANPYGPSYAVMVDPHGFLATQGLALNVRPWVGGVGPVNGSPTGTTGGLLRRPVSFTTAPRVPLALNQITAIKQSFSYPDDIVFNNDPFTGALPTGAPPPGTPTIASNVTNPYTMMRDTPFSWTYVLQRPRAGDSSIVNCTIVIFENRPLLLTGLANKAQLQEFVYTGVAFNTTANTITITTPAQPPVRPGDWLYDATIILPNPVQNILFPEIVSAFYRVVAVDEIAVNTYRYELQQPIKLMVNDPGFKLTPRQRTLPGTVIVMEGISEVFERGPARVP